MERITAAEFAHRFRKNGEPVFDVRKHSEFDAKHVEGVVNIQPNPINKFLSAFPKNAPFVLHCAAGYRSMIAASILKQRGWNNFVDVIGGFTEMAKTDLPLTVYQKPTTML